jgi:signal transduction histidine kinase
VDRSLESSVLDRIAVGVIVLDPEGQEVYRTRRVDELIGGTQLADPSRLARRLAALAHRCPAGGAREEECFEGGDAGVRASAAALPGGGAVVTLESMAPSDQVQQRVRQFVSHVTHDLRTPLTSIMGASDLLLSGRVGAVEERHAKLLRIVGEGSQRMASLLSELASRFVEPEVRS